MLNNRQGEYAPEGYVALKDREITQNFDTIASLISIKRPKQEEDLPEKIYISTTKRVMTTRRPPNDNKEAQKGQKAKRIKDDRDAKEPTNATNLHITKTYWDYLKTYDTVHTMLTFLYKEQMDYICKILRKVLPMMNSSQTRPDKSMSNDFIKEILAVLTNFTLPLTGMQIENAICQYYQRLQGTTQDQFGYIHINRIDDRILDSRKNLSVDDGGKDCKKIQKIIPDYKAYKLELNDNVDKKFEEFEKSLTGDIYLKVKKDFLDVKANIVSSRRPGSEQFCLQAKETKYHNIDEGELVQILYDQEFILQYLEWRRDELWKALCSSKFFSFASIQRRLEEGPSLSELKEEKSMQPQEKDGHTYYETKTNELKTESKEAMTNELEEEMTELNELLKGKPEKRVKTESNEVPHKKLHRKGKSKKEEQMMTEKLKSVNQCNQQATDEVSLEETSLTKRIIKNETDDTPHVNGFRIDVTRAMIAHKAMISQKDMLAKEAEIVTIEKKPKKAKKTEFEEEMNPEKATVVKKRKQLKAANYHVRTSDDRQATGMLSLFSENRSYPKANLTHSEV